MEAAVGFIGIGNMGLAMALRLRERGWPVQVRDIDARQVDAAVAAGAVPAASPAALGAACGLVIVAVVDAAQAEAVLFGADGAADAMPRGACVMLCPTMAPGRTEALAARLAQAGIDCIDAPMSGGPRRARDGSMSLMIACDDAVFERQRHVVEALSSNVFRLGARTGDGARTKLVNNLLAAVNLAGAAEALALATALGLDGARVQAVIERSSGQSWIGGDRMRRALAGDFTPHAHAALLEKDTALAVAMAEGAGFEPALGRRAAAVFAAACSAGHGGKDDGILLEFLRQPPASVTPAEEAACDTPEDSEAQPRLDAGLAARYADVVLRSLNTAYPYALQQLMRGPTDRPAPDERHPLFNGSYDWHSSVHMQWSLARLLRLYPQLAARPAIVGLFEGRYSEASAERELEHLEANPAFERPYGWGWLLQLQAEIRALQPVHGAATRWAAWLEPLAALLRRRWLEHLALAPHPQRAGNHANSAFAMQLALDAAERNGDIEFAQALKAAACRWFGGDVAYPARYEPSASDFLSPGLCAAVLMQRALPSPAAFVRWWQAYEPAGGEIETWLHPAPVASRTDGQLVHADGLNLSRAWCLGALAPHVPARLCSRFERARVVHLRTALPHVDGGEFVATHWLVSFALLGLGGLRDAMPPDHPMR